MWQPIETAPKDGKRVLITNGKYVHTAIWGESWNSEKGGKERYGWWDGIDGGDPYYSICFEDVTHWMPLPAPPTPSQKNEGNTMKIGGGATNG